MTCIQTFFLKYSHNPLHHGITAAERSLILSVIFFNQSIHSLTLFVDYLMIQSLFHYRIQHFSLLIDHAQQFCSFLHSDSSSCALSGKTKSSSVPFRMFLSKLPVFANNPFVFAKTSNYILLLLFPKSQTNREKSYRQFSTI